MARRGRKRQLDAESLYWQPLLSGIGRLRHAWRRASAARPGTGGGRTTAVPPVRLAETARSGR